MCALGIPARTRVRFAFVFAFFPYKKYCLTNHSGSVILVMFSEVVSVMKRDANDQDRLETGIDLLRLPHGDLDGRMPRLWSACIRPEEVVRNEEQTEV